MPQPKNKPEEIWTLHARPEAADIIVRNGNDSDTVCFVSRKKDVPIILAAPKMLQVLKWVSEDLRIPGGQLDVMTIDIVCQVIDEAEGKK